MDSRKPLQGMPLIQYQRDWEPRPYSSADQLIIWFLIGAFVLITLIGCLAGAGKVINYLFPAAAAMLAGFLYHRNPVIYVGFTWWIVFLSPFVRRIADFKGSFTEPSPILLAPYLVAFVPIIYIYQLLPRMTRQGITPFIWPIAGILYSFVIALLNRTTAEALRGLLDWLAPVIFGCSFFLNWRRYPALWRNTQLTFTWAALLLGGYGIFQYLTAPGWDSQWIVNTQFDALAPGFSQPGPQGIRVFSTLNSQEPFAGVMTALLLVALNSGLPITGPGTIVGILSLLLSSVRSGILALVAGIVTLFLGSRLASQMRLIVIGGILITCLIPLVGMEEFRDLIQSRLETLNDIGNDGSASGRAANFVSVLDMALLSLLGAGIGGSTFDNGLLCMLMNLGWIGTIPYIIGIGTIFGSLAKNNSSASIPIIRAVIVSCLIRLPVNTPMLEASGMILWGFLGLGLSALAYEQTCVRKMLEVTHE
jgi:hypothetical protein